MASITKINENYIPKDGDWLKVDGVLSDEDINKINLMQRKTILIINNTKSLSSNIVSQIKNPNITFSVVGGLDYFNKEKYKNPEYISRTMMSPFGLAAIIKYYEELEKHISPKWNDTQKCMFIYDSIAKDFTYEENYKTPLEKGLVERSLNGILYKKLVCAGFAMVFKEALDRIGINNYYQNQKGSHAWNIVELEGKLRGLELTWDCANKTSDNVCTFKYFGQDPNFYKNKYHSLSKEIEDIDWFESHNFEDNISTKTIYEEETQYELTPFTREELVENYNVISPAINNRIVNQNPIFNSSEEEIRMLPIDRLRMNLLKRSEIEQNYYLLYQFLKNSGELENEEFSLLEIRNSFNSDVLGTFSQSSLINNRTTFNGRDIGLEKLANCEFSTNGDFFAPFGIKHTISNKNNIMDENAKNDAFNLLKNRLREYSLSYANELLNNAEKLLKYYQKIQALEIEKDLNISFIEADLYSKLFSLIKSKDLLISSGLDINVDIIDEIQMYFETIAKEKEITFEEQKENDLDFLLTFFGDVQEIRQTCERYDGHTFTDNEWNDKCTNANYMLKVFPKLQELNIPTGTVEEVLNSLYFKKDDKNIITK